jgi:hypothetical protein
MGRSLLSVLVGALLWACSSGAAPTRPPAPSQTTVPSVALSNSTATPSPNLASASVAPKPSLASGIETSGAQYTLRDHSFGVSGEVVVPIRNVGAGWIRVRPTKSRYTIHASGGAVLYEDSFSWSYPSDLGPGDHGYLATQTTFRTGKAANVERIDVELSFAPIDQADTVILTLAKVTTKNFVQGGVNLGVITTGTVTNPSSKILSGYDIGAFYFGGDGKVLGFTALNPGTLRANQTIDFSTLPMAEGFDRAAIAKIEVFPASWCDCSPG